MGYLNRSSESTTTFEKWLSATCDWMKDPESFATWNRTAWYVDIERYNCLNGCGVEANGGIYGDSCDYYTGQCVHEAQVSVEAGNELDLSWFGAVEYPTAEECDWVEVTYDSSHDWQL